jgi:hypothetical protein
MNVFSLAFRQKVQEPPRSVGKFINPPDADSLVKVVWDEMRHSRYPNGHDQIFGQTMGQEATSVVALISG